MKKTSLLLPAHTSPKYDKMKEGKQQRGSDCADCFYLHSLSLHVSRAEIDRIGPIIKTVGVISLEQAALAGLELCPSAWLLLTDPAP